MENRLAELIERRDRLYQAWIIYALVLAVSLVLSRVSMRFYGGRAFFIVLVVVTIVMAAVGLVLLANTIATWREIRIEKVLKQKREEGAFLLTDDGEIMPIVEDRPIDLEQEDHLKLRRH